MKIRKIFILEISKKDYQIVRLWFYFIIMIYNVFNNWNGWKKKKNSLH